MTDALASATMQAQKSLNFDFHEQVKEVFSKKWILPAGHALCVWPANSKICLYPCTLFAHPHLSCAQ